MSDAAVPIAVPGSSSHARGSFAPRGGPSSKGKGRAPPASSTSAAAAGADGERKPKKFRHRKTKEEVEFEKEGKRLAAGGDGGLGVNKLKAALRQAKRLAGRVRPPPPSLPPSLPRAPAAVLVWNCIADSRRACGSSSGGPAGRRQDRDGAQDQGPRDGPREGARPQRGEEERDQVPHGSPPSPSSAALSLQRRINRLTRRSSLLARPLQVKFFGACRRRSSCSRPPPAAPELTIPGPALTRPSQSARSSSAA